MNVPVVRTRRKPPHNEPVGYSNELIGPSVNPAVGPMTPKIYLGIPGYSDTSGYFVSGAQHWSCEGSALSPRPGSLWGR